MNAVSVDVARAGARSQAGSYVLYRNLSGAGIRGNGGGAWQRDVVVDVDVAVEAVVAALADGDDVSVLLDRRIADNLIHAGFCVAGVIEQALAGAQVSVDVDLGVGAGMQMHESGAGRDGDDGRGGHG